jgi:hypothetical protein
LVVLLHDLGATSARRRPIAARWATAMPKTAFVALDGIEQLEPSSYGSTEPTVLESRDLPSRLAVAFALVIHELATNAAKYGALSQEQGRVHIAWQIHGDRLELKWIETGGPVIKAPSRHGLGTGLITGLVSSLAGEIVKDFQPSGLTCRIVFDLRVQSNSQGIKKCTREPSNGLRAFPPGEMET